MRSKKTLLSFAAVLLVPILALILLPSGREAFAAPLYMAKISPGLAQQLSAASSNDMVAAVVKMKAKPNLDRIRGKRAEVITELRRNARVSQRTLLDYLAWPTMRAKVRMTRSFWIDNIVLVEATKDVIDNLAKRPEVEEVFENFTITLPPRPETNGPSVLEVNQAQTQLWDSIKKIGAKQVWSTFGFNGTGVVVGGLDTGVDISHPDIAGKMKTNNPADPTYPGGWAEFNSSGGIVAGSVPHDSDQHGTHTTGTMIGGNASGYDIGVAPGAKLIHGLVIPGGSGSFTQVAAGMQWIIDPDGNPATDDGADVVNMSLGATGTYPQMIAPTDNMAAANVFPSFSIGNSGPGSNTTGSPGNVPSAYGIGATDSNDVIASFSSRGPVTWNSPPYVGTWTKPDISAPGVKIYSTIPGGTWQWHGAGWDWSGTSMAAPHTSGTVALIRQANPSLTVDQIKQLLAQTAVDRDVPGMDNNYGWGRVNAFAAVSAAVAGMGHISGTVTSSTSGLPVANVAVMVVETGQKVFTNASGYYDIMVVAGTHAIEVSRFGYETATIPGVVVVADAVTVQDVALNQLPSGTIAGFVTDIATGNGITAGIAVKLGGSTVLTAGTDPATGAYSVSLPIGTYDLVFSPGFPYPVTTRANVEVLEGATTTLDVALQAAQVLIVDDDGGSAYQTFYEQAVVAAGRSYLTVTSPPTAAQMAMFSAVVWLTGDDYSTTLTTADQTQIAAFLNGGGRLFLSGQDIGYDIGTSAFYADYLHAAYVQDDVALGGVLGNSLNPVGFGFAFDIQGGDGADNQAYPSEIDPLSPGLAAFVYNPAVPSGSASNYSEVGKQQLDANGITSSGTAGLTFENDTYKLVYLAFGFEAISSGATRGEVMDRVLDWLQGFPDIVHTPLGPTEDTEHPYRVSAVITSDYFPLDPATFAVVYDVGGPAVTVQMTATGTPNEYEAYIPAQPIDTQVNYFITATDVEGHTSTHPMGAPTNKHSFMVAKDTEDPVVEHRRHRDTNDLVGPYAICAGVTDNIGVESVYLMYSKSGGPFHRQELLPGQDGQYCGAIPGPSVVGDYYDYYILAMDESYSGNVTRMPATGTYHFDVVAYFAWDFEADDGGYAPTGGAWEWGVPTSGPNAAHSGTKLWATVLAGNYPNNANAKLDAPAVALSPNQQYATLTFWHWYSTENSYDGGNVKVSADNGATWTLLTPFGGYDGTASTANKGIPGEKCFMGTTAGNFWQQELFDLSPYVGKDIMIRYHFGSDGSVSYPGWYVDDVMIQSMNTDEVAPIFSAVEVPGSTFNTVGPYTVKAKVRDFLSTVGAVSLFYSTDGGLTFTEVPMSPTGVTDQFGGSVPGQASGTVVKLYVKAWDTASPANASTSPAGAPAQTYEFGILPTAPALVVIGSTSVASLDTYREALEAYGHRADYWNRGTQGWPTLAQLSGYKTLILDESSGLTAQQMTDLTAFLNSGSLDNKKQIMLLGRDLEYNTTTRAWMEQYTKAAYVQDDPAYRQITGEPGEPIGAGETFVISGSYPDEVQRSETYPGGEIIYRFTGTGTALDREEVEGSYAKEGKEWDGVMPHLPKSLDAAAGMKYAGEKYRSVYFTFNLSYVLQADRRAGIMHRSLNWLAAPEIMHVALHDTEDTLSAYPVVAQVYSETLDPSRVKLTYDVGGGPVQVVMAATGNPDEYAAAIPPQKYGTTVSYYISAANLDGTTSYHPAGAPGQQHTFVVSSDMTPPVIVHTPVGTTTDLVGPYTVSATITDNVGVDPAQVFLTYNKNGGANVTLPMAAVGGNVYQAAIPGPSVLGDVYGYYILARDVAAVPNTARDPLTGYHTLQIVDYYAWDFETDNGGFTLAGPDWEWGDPTSGPMDAHSGVNVWATKLAGPYSNASNSKLDLPPVTVPSGHTFARMSFWQWYNIESNYDGGNVKASTDGGATWTVLRPDIGYNGLARTGNAGIPAESCFTGPATGNFWHRVAFDLTPYKGQSVLLRLHFGSDGSVNLPGWYVDDFRIEGMEDTEGPVITATKVPASTFNTTGPYDVTTTVSDFYSGVASVTLYYSTNSGASWTPVAMLPTATPKQYKGSIPGQPGRTRIMLYVEAADGSGNVGRDPAAAPATWYEFSIMPWGDYMVLLGGTSHTNADTVRAAFSALGKTVDIWDVDDSGNPTTAILDMYVAVMLDHSTSPSTTLQSVLSTWLDAAGPTKNQLFILGRDLEYYSGNRTWMEKYTGTVYVKDDPGWRQITGRPGDPIGAGETFTISGSYPDEVKLSTLYPGAVVVYTYSGLGSSSWPFETETELMEFYDKEGKAYDPKLWPMAPTGPDSIAAARFVKETCATVYFAFNFSYITQAPRRTVILQRVLDWLASVAGSLGEQQVAGTNPVPLPDRLGLAQNYPNPFNPLTTIQLSIPAGPPLPVCVRIYDVRGQLVKTLFEGIKEPGVHSFEWNGMNQAGFGVSSGVYFCNASAGKTVMTRKMMLLR